MLGSLRLGCSSNTHWHKIVAVQIWMPYDVSRQSEKMLLYKRPEKNISIAVKHTFLSARKCATLETRSCPDRVQSELWRIILCFFLFFSVALVGNVVKRFGLGCGIRLKCDVWRTSVEIPPLKSSRMSRRFCWP